jgi:hypothetical protein
VRLRSAIAVLSLVGLVLLTACSSEQSSTVVRTLSDETACPAPNTTPLSDTPVVVFFQEGNWDDACIGSIVGNDVVLPDLSPRWSRETSSLAPEDSTRFQLNYKPNTPDDLVVELHISFPASERTLGEAQTTPAGHNVRIYSEGCSANWPTSSNYYQARFSRDGRCADGSEAAPFIVDRTWEAAERSR